MRTFIVVCLLASCGGVCVAQTPLPAGNGLRSGEPTRLAPTAAPRPASPPVDNQPPLAADAKRALQEAHRLSQEGTKVDDFSQIISHCEQALGMNLTAEETAYAKNLLSWAYNRRGEVKSLAAAENLQAGNEPESAKLDREALKDFHASIRVDNKRWKAFHNRGVSYGLLGLHNDAVKDFSRVIELKPDYPNAWFNRAEVYAEQGKLEEAVSDYTETIALSESDAAAYAGRARCLALQKKFDDAEADYAKAMELEPTDPELHVQLGEVHVRRSQWKAAAQEFRAAIEMDRTHASAYRSAAWLMATCPEAKFRNAKLALEAAEKAVDLADQAGTLDYTYYDTLAAALANAGNFNDARQYLTSALEQSPSEAVGAMQHRLALYRSEKPYRIGGGVVQQASATSRERRVER